MLIMADELRGQMSPVFEELGSKIQSEDYQELSKWHMQKGVSRSEIITEITTQIIEKISECLPKSYLQLAINNINIDDTDKQTNVGFDVEYELEPLRFYVEFQIRMNGNYITSGRVRFEITTNGTFKELKFQKNKKEDKKFKIQFGHLDANIGISLIGLPFVTSMNPREIVKNNSQ